MAERDGSRPSPPTPRSRRFDPWLVPLAVLLVFALARIWGSETVPTVPYSTFVQHLDLSLIHI